MNKKMKSSNDPNMLGKLGKWNWGAFGFGLIWAVFNIGYRNTFFTFLAYCALTLCFNGLGIIILHICLGIMGNDLSWKNKEYSGVEEFRRIQSKWTIAFEICFVSLISLVSIFCLITISTK